MISKMKFLIMAALMFTLAQVAGADDVQDSIKEGLDYYKAGNLNEAAASLSYATQLIQQQKGEAMTKLLPKAPAGWTVDSSSSDSAAMGMFGGGITAEREYSKGDKYVKVSLVSDSPVLQGVMMMFSNPMFAGADGGKLERIKGQKAIVSFKSGADSGEIKIVVDNRILISLEGSSVTREELTSFVEAIDFEGLKKS